MKNEPSQDKGVIIVPGRLLEKIDQCRDKLSRAEFVEFCADALLKQEEEKDKVRLVAVWMSHSLVVLRLAGSFVAKGLFPLCCLGRVRKRKAGRELRLSRLMPIYPRERVWQSK